MYNIYQKHHINLASTPAQDSRLYTTHFEEKIKPGLKPGLPYYTSAEFYNRLFYID